MASSSSQTFVPAGADMDMARGGLGSRELRINIVNSGKKMIGVPALFSNSGEKCTVCFRFDDVRGTVEVDGEQASGIFDSDRDNGRYEATLSRTSADGVRCYAGKWFNNKHQSGGFQLEMPQVPRPLALGESKRRRIESTTLHHPIVFMEWNIWWKNTKHSELASICQRRHDKPPDVIGICELSPHNPWQLASNIATSLTALVPGRRYVPQSAIRGRWKGYGTDIIYDANRFDCLEEGKETVFVAGTRGGNRAANWVVLQEKSSGGIFITGGMHLSSGVPSNVHRAELKKLYANFSRMKRNYPTAPIIWMGDLNALPSGPVVSDLLSGRIGNDTTFRVDNVVQTLRRTLTHAWGEVEPVIDHILADKSVNIRRLNGGRADLESEQQKEYKSGTWLAGADHYPVFAELDW